MKLETLLSNIFAIAILIAAASMMSHADPGGAVIDYNVSETKTPSAAQYLNTSGGSFTTLILSSETQNLKWKAYAGNVTGVLTLDDDGDYSIFQWEETDFTGEVYASRNDSVSWDSISCASLPQIYAEETYMNHTTSRVDSINSTFAYRIHKEFYVGNTRINESTCKSAFTWVNDTAQTPDIDAPFQEVLLHDGNSVIYTTFIDDDTQGFNYESYDFQMILAEKGVGGYASTKYYFYLELQ